MGRDQASKTPKQDNGRTTCRQSPRQIFLEIAQSLYVTGIFDRVVEGEDCEYRFSKGLGQAASCKDYHGVGE